MTNVLLENLESLVGVLEKESEALVSHQPDRLPEIVRQKSALIGDLSALLQVPEASDGIRLVSSSLDPLIRRVMSLQERNNSLVRHASYYNNLFLSWIKGDSHVLYNRQGSAQENPAMFLDAKG